MTDKCVVPNCKNATSADISFSSERELPEKWLKSSQIKIQAESGYFECLNHLEENKLIDGISDDNTHETTQILARSTQSPPKNEKKEEKVCRLCMGTNNVSIDVLAAWDDTFDVATLIKKCIPEVTILPQDLLSKLICTQCLETIQKFYAFRNICLQTDANQRQILRNMEKRKLRKEENSSGKSKRKKSDKSVDDQTLSNKSSIEIKFKQIEKELMETLEGDVVENVTCLNVRNELDNCESVHQQLTSDYEDLNLPVAIKKLDQVELELMKVIEGKLTEEMKSAENIIIEVRSDDEGEDGGESSRSFQENNVSNVVRIGLDELKLPKSIRVTSPRSQTELVSFSSNPLQGILDSEFCSVGNYLFEIGLCKGNIRHLRCLTPRCTATARQDLSKPGNSEESITMKSTHNHRPPSHIESKRHILCHVMRRKMQTDKTLNFRAVYEEFCVKDPEIKHLVPLKSVINQVCCQQLASKHPPIKSFDEFYEAIEDDGFEKLHFTHTNVQWYQERFTSSDGAKAVVFANQNAIQQVSDSKVMYVDASFKIDTKEAFTYQLVTILVWVEDSYYPILFALVNEKTQLIYEKLFHYLRDTLAPSLRPNEIVTDYEACLYYALGETYLDSHIGGSVFYYTQNLYKKICCLNLSRDLETNSYFRNIYHMILMLPLLPVNTIFDGLKNIELQACELGLGERTRPIFEHVRSEWMQKVTPELFCVHRLENRINENVIAPFKKLRDFLMLSKGKLQKSPITIVSVVEKLIELEGFLQVMYSAPSKKSFARDLSSSQKKNVIRAWQFIESHPKININNFFTKVLGYIKCMENQLWIWGFYRYAGDISDDLINAANFSIVNTENDDVEQSDYVYPVEEDVVMDVVIDENDGFLVKEAEGEGPGEIVKASPFQSAYVDYVAKD